MIMKLESRSKNRVIYEYEMSLVKDRNEILGYFLDGSKGSYCAFIF